jgi:hypothetical protein
MTQGAGFLNARGAVEVAQSAATGASIVFESASPVVRAAAAAAENRGLVWSASGAVDDVLWRGPAIRRPRLMLVEPALR